MGGGGSFYNRDTTDKDRITSGGYSDLAEEKLSRSNINKAVLPENRKIVSTCKSPLVYAFDVTGSMGDLPKIIWDKMPMIAGQIKMQKYLDDTMISLSAIGDVISDRAPIQICDFSKLKSLDEWLERLWLESRGGGQGKESYEFTAYFYARLYDMQNAKTPIFLFTGDEGFREQLPAKELEEHFGGKHETVSAENVFKELKNKFKNNVFLIHKTYGDEREDEFIIKQWQKVLGEENVILLKNKLAIADVTLGVIAIASGAKTLDEYIKDVKNRPLEMSGVKYEPQTPERSKEVRESLKFFAESRNKAGKKVSNKNSSSQNKTNNKAKNTPKKEWQL